jgi:hypothetical protein
MMAGKRRVFRAAFKAKVALATAKGARDARALTASLRDEYNTQRPHNSLGYQTPTGFAAAFEDFASAKASAQAAHAAFF